MTNLGWSWKDKDKPKVDKNIKVRLSRKERRKRKRSKSKGLKQPLPDALYASKEWRSLRYKVIKKYGGACMACGRTRKHHGVVIHVDHIKPRSIYPDLALDFDNLQLLCEDCNLGKGNKCDIDWRPDY